jgi:hypothetical protein
MPAHAAVLPAGAEVTIMFDHPLQRQRWEDHAGIPVRFLPGRRGIRVVLPKAAPPGGGGVLISSSGARPREGWGSQYIDVVNIFLIAVPVEEFEGARYPEIPRKTMAATGPKGKSIREAGYPIPMARGAEEYSPRLRAYIKEVRLPAAKTRRARIAAPKYHPSPSPPKWAS